MHLTIHAWKSKQLVVGGQFSYPTIWDLGIKHMVFWLDSKSLAAEPPPLPSCDSFVVDNCKKRNVLCLICKIR